MILKSSRLYMYPLNMSFHISHVSQLLYNELAGLCIYL